MTYRKAPALETAPVGTIVAELYSFELIIGEPNVIELSARLPAEVDLTVWRLPVPVVSKLS